MREHVNPSEIWQQEDENFPSWLGKNLKLLDEILNIQLDLERPVGPFFADLLCRPYGALPWGPGISTEMSPLWG
ncbi:MAG: hypothetical protein OXI61_20320 [Candidatus Poribacteria bacterium]|nr:hypothetical protein [Candidatus Poribacteria bacterium]